MVKKAVITKPSTPFDTILTALLDFADTAPRKKREHEKPMQPGDVFVGVLSERLRPIFYMANSHFEEAMSYLPELRKTLRTSEMKKTLNKFKSATRKYLLIYQFLWVAIQDELELWDKCNLSMRKDWQIVATGDCTCETSRCSTHSEELVMLKAALSIPE